MIKNTNSMNSTNNTNFFTQIPETEYNHKMFHTLKIKAFLPIQKV